jgi:hypothetical protein
MMGEFYKDTKHTRHIFRWYHYVHKGITWNRIKMQWIHTKFQIADIGAKPTPDPPHKFKWIPVKVKDQSKRVESIM